VAAFLSDEWIRALALACEGALAPATTSDAEASDAGRFVIEPVVTGVPDLGEVRYQIAFQAGTCAVEAASEGAAADVWLETDYVTAVALSRGTANAQAALADGRLRVSGDVARLAAQAAALAALDDLFAALRATTTYPAP
jgi:predicted lipid carrier protein YhbT